MPSAEGVEKLVNRCLKKLSIGLSPGVVDPYPGFVDHVIFVVPRGVTP